MTRTARLLWQVPLVVTCAAASLAIVWVASKTIGFTMNPSLVVVLSVVLSAAAIAGDVWRTSPR